MAHVDAATRETDDTDTDIPMSHKLSIDNLKTPRKAFNVILNATRTPGNKQLQNLTSTGTKKAVGRLGSTDSASSSAFSVYVDDDDASTPAFSLAPDRNTFKVPAPVRDETREEDEEEIESAGRCSPYKARNSTFDNHLQEMCSTTILYEKPEKKPSITAGGSTTDSVRLETKPLGSDDYPPVEKASRIEDYDDLCGIHDEMAELFDKSDVVLREKSFTIGNSFSDEEVELAEMEENASALRELGVEPWKLEDYPPVETASRIEHYDDIRAITEHMKQLYELEDCVLTERVYGKSSYSSDEDNDDDTLETFSYGFQSDLHFDPNKTIGTESGDDD